MRPRSYEYHRNTKSSNDERQSAQHAQTSRRHSHWIKMYSKSIPVAAQSIKCRHQPRNSNKQKHTIQHPPLINKNQHYTCRAWCGHSLMTKRTTYVLLQIVWMEIKTIYNATRLTQRMAAASHTAVRAHIRSQINIDYQFSVKQFAPRSIVGFSLSLSLWSRHSVLFSTGSTNLNWERKRDREQSIQDEGHRIWL